MGDCDFTVLVATLLFVGHLVLDLDGTSARLDHLPRQQVGCFSITKTGVDIRDDRHNVRLKVVDLLLRSLLCSLISGCACRIQRAKQSTELSSIGLP